MTFEAENRTFSLHDISELIYFPCNPHASDSVLEVRIWLQDGQVVSLVSERARDFWNAWKQTLRNLQA